MEKRVPPPTDSLLHLLSVTQALWGERIASNIRAHAPSDWVADTWAAPRVIPPIVDDPDEYLPASLPTADLVLALGEVAGLAQLIPDIVRRCGARAVIAPIDRNESIPPGLVRQLVGWLSKMGVAAAFPKPFCSLTPSTYNRTPLVTTYDDAVIRRFAQAFGRPELHITVSGGQIDRAEVIRDAACGCARHVAEGLPGTPVDDTIEAAGMLHHHYPCLASMNKDPDYRDTLMHISGNIMKDSLKEEIQQHLALVYIRPDGRVEKD